MSLVVPVFDLEGKVTGEMTLPASIFGAQPNTHLIYLDVKRILADRRQGTHKTKTRGQVKGSTRKLYKQKGTGRARMGSIRNPIRRGGGVIFGPVPRDYSLKLNKKEKIRARISALSAKAQTGLITVVDQWTIPSPPKTRFMVQALYTLKLPPKGLILYSATYNPSGYLATRNLPYADFYPVDMLNTYDVMRAQRVIFEKNAIEKLQTLLA
ncbi:MAG: 50S ribosomal protein L4 [Bacteroidia bacterium]